MLAIDGILWLPADVIRTVVRRLVPEVDAVDQDPVDAATLAENVTGPPARCSAAAP